MFMDACVKGEREGRKRRENGGTPGRFIEGMREDIVKLGCDGYWNDSLQGWETVMEQEDSETISHC